MIEELYTFFKEGNSINLIPSDNCFINSLLLIPLKCQNKFTAHLKLYPVSCRHLDIKNCSNYLYLSNENAYKHLLHNNLLGTGQFACMMTYDLTLENFNNVIQHFLINFSNGKIRLYNLTSYGQLNVSCSTFNDLRIK